MDPIQASILGTREIGPAVLATTISLVIVFLPVSFLSSVTGRMLFQFGITATVAILVSMLVSFTLTPMMCSKLLAASHGKSELALVASRVVRLDGAGLHVVAAALNAVSLGRVAAVRRDDRHQLLAI